MLAEITRGLVPMRAFLSHEYKVESAKKFGAGVMESFEYPDAIDPSLVGTYSALVKCGGGFVWDAVLEYRVWCHPERGAPDEEGGNDYYYPFATHAEALAFSIKTVGAEEPLALIQQLESINEPEPGVYVHVKEPRITEWPVEFLRRPKRTNETIPAFFAPDAPANRLDILRGIAKPPNK